MTTTPKFTSFFEKSAESMKQSVLHQLKFHLAQDVQSSTKRDWWLATSQAVQERIIERMIATQAVHNQQDVRRVYYLSLEFLMGRLFTNSLYNAGIHEETKQALRELGLDMDELRGEEYDMGPGQRRSRPPGRVLPRFAGHAGLSRHRLRHPLRVRPLPPGVQPWPPDRAAG